MLTKILFTALVIFSVYAFYRLKRRVPIEKTRAKQAAQSSPVGRYTAYGFVAMLLVVSSIVFLYQWQQAHKIVTIRVIDGNSGNVTVYKAYRKSIKGSRFESLDGKSVVLGEAERVEYIDEE